MSRRSGLFRTYKRIYPFSSPFFIKIKNFVFNSLKYSYLELYLNKLFIKEVFKNNYLG